MKKKTKRQIAMHLNGNDISDNNIYELIVICCVRLNAIHHLYILSHKEGLTGTYTYLYFLLQNILEMICKTWFFKTFTFHP